jgi:5-formyltetrahydrofolate cyclo-ligase
MAFFSFADKKKKKDALRELARERKKTVSKEQEQKANEEIQLRLLQSPFFLEAESIFSYVSVEGEVDTKIILETALQMGKRVFVPRCIPGKERLMDAVEIHSMEELSIQYFGLLEPKPEIPASEERNFDLSLIPCVMADRRGGRLGHGAGYYDRFLAKSQGKKLCLCFSWYLTEKIPMEERDIPMDALLTEEGYFSFR